jgi:hypothetical protein
VHRGVTRPSSAGRSWISSRWGGRSSKSHDLQISAQAIYTWRRQQLIDSGQIQGMTSTDHAELVAARKQIAQLENEMVIHRRAANSSAMWCPQRALCGDHGNRQGGPALRGTDADAPGRDQGMPGSRPWPKHQTPTASDLVNRQFTRPAPDQLRVTGINRAPSREGKVYCAVVLDACIASDAVRNPLPLGPGPFGGGEDANQAHTKLRIPVNAMFKNWHVLRTLRGCAR